MTHHTDAGHIYAVPLAPDSPDICSDNAIAAAAALGATVIADYAVPTYSGQIYQEPDGGVSYASNI